MTSKYWDPGFFCKDIPTYVPPKYMKIAYLPIDSNTRPPALKSNAPPRGSTYGVLIYSNIYAHSCLAPITI